MKNTEIIEKLEKANEEINAAIMHLIGINTVRIEEIKSILMEASYILEGYTLAEKYLESRRIEKGLK